MSSMEPTTESQGQSQSQGQREVRREVIELVKMVVLFLVLFLLLKTFVVEGYEVQGDSMYPTLHEGERILVMKLPFKMSHLPLLGSLEPIKQGEIIVFESRDGTLKRYIKRVIARGPSGGANTVSATEHNAGAHVQYELGDVYVNQRRLEEPYLVEEERESPDVDETTLEEGEYYVLGDHRSMSKDSRSFGPVQEQQIIGEAFLRFWPLSRFGLL